MYNIQKNKGTVKPDNTQIKPTVPKQTPSKDCIFTNDPTALIAKVTKMRQALEAFYTRDAMPALKKHGSKRDTIEKQYQSINKAFAEMQQTLEHIDPQKQKINQTRVEELLQSGKTLLEDAVNREVNRKGAVKSALIPKFVVQPFHFSEKDIVVVEKTPKAPPPAAAAPQPSTTAHQTPTSTTHQPPTALAPTEQPPQGGAASLLQPPLAPTTAQPFQEPPAHPSTTAKQPPPASTAKQPAPPMTVDQPIQAHTPPPAGDIPAQASTHENIAKAHYYTLINKALETVESVTANTLQTLKDHPKKSGRIEGRKNELIAYYQDLQKKIQDNDLNNIVDLEAHIHDPLTRFQNTECRGEIKRTQTGFFKFIRKQVKQIEYPALIAPQITLVPTTEAPSAVVGTQNLKKKNKLQQPSTASSANVQKPSFFGKIRNVFKTKNVDQKKEKQNFFTRKLLNPVKQYLTISTLALGGTAILCLVSTLIFPPLATILAPAVIPLAALAGGAFLMRYLLSWIG